MKKVFLCVVFAVMASGVFAQEAGKVRGGFNIGPVFQGIGVTTDLQLGYNLQDNMNVGIKLALAAMGKVDPAGERASAAISYNFLGTFTYFLDLGGSFAPFVGAGMGIYTISSAAGGADWAVVGDVADNKFGGMLTAGFEIKRFRVGLEYNLIPGTKVKFVGVGPRPADFDDKITNSYLAATIGFYIGGGKR